MRSRGAFFPDCTAHDIVRLTVLRIYIESRRNKLRVTTPLSHVRPCTYVGLDLKSVSLDRLKPTYPEELHDPAVALHKPSHPSTLAPATTPPPAVRTTAVRTTHSGRRVHWADCVTLTDCMGGQIVPVFH